MANILEIIIKAVDQASGAFNTIGTSAKGAQKSLSDFGAGLDTVEKKSKSLTQVVEQHASTIRMAGVTIGLAGAGLQLFAMQQAKLTETTVKTASAVGMTEKEFRNLAAAITPASDSVSEFVELMRMGSRQGLESGEQLARYAEMWDKVADATGESAISLAETSYTLNALGIDFAEQEQAMTAFGFVTEECGANISDFLGLIGKAAPNMKAMGLSVDDAAIALGVLRDNGIAGRKAIGEVNKAMEESITTGKPLNETLGVSKQRWEEYRGELQKSSGVIEKNAKLHEDLVTPVEKVKNKLAELAYKYEGLGKAASVAAGPMMLVGGALTALPTLLPIINGLMTYLGIAQGTVATTGAAVAVSETAMAVATPVAAAGTGSLAIAVTALGTALLIAAPYLLIIGAILGVGYLAWKTYKGGVDDTTKSLGAANQALPTVDKNLQTLDKNLVQTGKDAETTGEKVDDMGEAVESTAGNIEVAGYYVDEFGNYVEGSGQQAEEAKPKFDDMGMAIENSGKQAEGSTLVFDEFGRQIEETGKKAEEGTKTITTELDKQDTAENQVIETMKRLGYTQDEIDKNTKAAFGSMTRTLADHESDVAIIMDDLIKHYQDMGFSIELATQAAESDIARLTSQWEKAKGAIGEALDSIEQKTEKKQTTMNEIYSSSEMELHAAIQTGSLSEYDTMTALNRIKTMGGTLTPQEKKLYDTLLAKYQRQMSAGQGGLSEEGSIGTDWMTTPTGPTIVGGVVMEDNIIGQYSGSMYDSEGHYIGPAQDSGGGTPYDTGPSFEEPTGIAPDRPVSKVVRSAGIHGFPPGQTSGVMVQVGNVGYDSSGNVVQRTVFPGMEDYTIQWEGRWIRAGDWASGMNSSPTPPTTTQPPTPPPPTVTTPTISPTPTTQPPTTTPPSSGTTPTTQPASPITTPTGAKEGDIVTLPSGASYKLQNNVWVRVGPTSSDTTTTANYNSLTDAQKKLYNEILAISRQAGAFDEVNGYSYAYNQARQYSDEEALQAADRLHQVYVQRIGTTSYAPEMAEGGEVISGGRVIVGERGRPEEVILPAGAKVKPLTGERDVEEGDYLAAIIAEAVRRALSSGVIRDVHLHGMFFGDEAALRNLNRKLRSVDNMERIRTSGGG